MKILIIDNQTQNLDLIKSFFPKDIVEVISCYNVEFEDSMNSDLIILSGSGPETKTAANKSELILKNELEIIRNSNKPIIGICYGCQLIAYAFNCKIDRITPRIVNFVEIQTAGEILGFHKKHFKVYDSHKYSITELSSEIEGLAKSENGYEVIKHKAKNIYGTQFHPEKFQDITEGDDIFRKILALI